MGLDGRLRDGTKIQRLPSCEFEGDGPGRHGEIRPCGDVAFYSVTFPNYNVMHACEEHAQRLWDSEEAQEATAERMTR